MNEITEQFKYLIDFGFDWEREYGTFSFFLHDYKGLNFSFYYEPTYENGAFHFHGDLHYNATSPEFDDQVWENIDAVRAVQIIEDFVPENKELKTCAVNFTVSDFSDLLIIHDKIKSNLKYLNVHNLEIKEVKND